ncbi:MAG: nicotinate-nucleotide adenylyltransferase [Chloroflexota bacterium]
MAGLIGVFGGTFDPPHIGHLVLASEARAALGLERVLWVVTAQPPHKPYEPITPVDIRLEMVEAALAGNAAFEPSRAEIDRPGPHYAVDTLRWLNERHPGARWAYLIGADSLRDLPAWHTPEALLDAVTILGVMRRPEVEPDLAALEARLPGLSQKLHFFDAPLIGVSASDIRRRVREGEPYRYLVPPGVPELIERHHLYR